MTVTVIQHVLARLRALGVTDVFGVPGDFAFPINDAICNDPGLRWIGCCNELNAGYAAEGYARLKGVGAVNTTYGVGELSALAAIAGAYAERLPVFHLVGMPNMALQRARSLVHHTLGTGEFDCYRRMAEPAVCAHAVMTPQNVAYETERLISEALYHRRPVYMAFPGDLAEQPVLGATPPIAPPRSDPASLEKAVDAVVAALDKARSACVLPGILLARAGLQAAMQAVIDKSGLPFATMFMDKTVLDERQPAYIGMYDGALMNEGVRDFVEGCDRVLAIGTLLTDFNTGAFTARLDPARTITIMHHYVRIDGHVYPSVEMGDVLAQLARRLPGRKDRRGLEVGSLGEPVGHPDEPITAAALYPRWAAFLRPNDLLVAETGTASMGLGFAHMPAGALFLNQTLWGAIGWATPAAFGVAVAAPGRRVVLVTGEGSHQITAQEVSQFARYGLKPIIFVLNNSGYLIERLLCRNPAIAYNDVAPWRYTELPHALGCDDWLTARVTTYGALDRALDAANRAERAAYIEVVTDACAASPLALKLHENIKALYKN
jgi:indolepyruvate decarboxylase